MMTLELRPGPRPVRVRLLVPAAIAARGRVRVSIETTTWTDPLTGQAHGLHVGGQWVLVEPLPDPPRAEAAIERTIVDRRAEELPATRSIWGPGPWHDGAGVRLPVGVRGLLLRQLEGALLRLEDRVPR